MAKTWGGGGCLCVCVCRPVVDTWECRIRLRTLFFCITHRNTSTAHTDMHASTWENTLHIYTLFLTLSHSLSLYLSLSLTHTHTHTVNFKIQYSNKPPPPQTHTHENGNLLFAFCQCRTDRVIIGNECKQCLAGSRVSGQISFRKSTSKFNIQTNKPHNPPPPTHIHAHTKAGSFIESQCFLARTDFFF